MAAMDTKCSPAMYFGTVLHALDCFWYSFPASVNADRLFESPFAGGATSSRDQCMSISNGLSNSLSEPRPRNPYIKSKGGSTYVRRWKEEPVTWIALMMETPPDFCVSISSRFSNCFAGKFTVGKVLMHSASSMSLVLICTARFVVSTAVLVMPLLSKSRTNRSRMLLRWTCLF